MTGGALGSMIAQLFHLTGAERKTLLVAGAAGAWPPPLARRSPPCCWRWNSCCSNGSPAALIPVALAATPGRAALHSLGRRAVPGSAAPERPRAAGLRCLVGLLAGGLRPAHLDVYAAEDSFHRLPIHWMWWPAIGGLVVGIGGLYPHALGVGYDVIGDLLQGNGSRYIIMGVLAGEIVIWAVSLGSGTSAGCSLLCS